MNDDWLVGELHHRKGHLPAAFVDHVPTDLPLEDQVDIYDNFLHRSYTVNPA